MIEIVSIAKQGGPLTKRIFLNDKGKVVSDGSACVMAGGKAKRVRLKNMADFAILVPALNSSEAIALGRLRCDLLDEVVVTTQGKLGKSKTSANAFGIIARNAEHICYEGGQPAIALLDVDTKGMPPSIAEKIESLGGFENAIATVLPEITTTQRLVRKSTSAGLYRSDNNEPLPGSDGLHIYLLVKDGADIPRFLKTLHERCWLAGFGWLMVGEGGQLLDRSIIDRMVGAPERLVFEGAPILVDPVAQDANSRKPEVRGETILDTKAACQPLRIVEQSDLKAKKAAATYTLAPERAKERDRFVAKHTAALAERTGITEAQARHIITRQCEGVLLPDVVLPWDDETLAGCTVADVLADPGQFEGATLADPLEGVSYGRGKAMVMRRADGTPWINSFAHGRTVYELRYDARAAGKAIDNAPADEVADVFVSTVTNGDMDAEQEETLRNKVCKITRTTKRAITNKLKAKQTKHSHQAKQEDRERKAAERKDPRPQVLAPAPDAPWLPQVEVLNDVLGSSTAEEPPARDVDGLITMVRSRRVPKMHLFTSDGANGEESEDKRHAAPEQLMLARLDENHLAELIERHIDYADKDGRSVHLAQPFVRHYIQRPEDTVLPIISAISTLPIVLPNGNILSTNGLDRLRGIMFRVQPHILGLIPTREECSPDKVANAMHFLTHEWLADVATSYIGKCVSLSIALTIIERSILDNRPAFFTTAGRRGGGKTTLLMMLHMAVTGVRPAAAAWSDNVEERRKAILAYLLGGLPCLLWDNIPRGSRISCPFIEQSCTTAMYSDRKLGVSEYVAVSAATVHLFTGNNIKPKGDLASRSPEVRLEVDRHDPENRPFKHSDPIAWTETNRAKILRALYVIFLGNPALDLGEKAEIPTRFKMWWRTVGAAIENAAKQHTDAVSSGRIKTNDGDDKDKPHIFAVKNIFLSQEADEEDGSCLANAIVAFDQQWPTMTGLAPVRITSKDLAALLNRNDPEQQSAQEKERVAVLREFLFPQQKMKQDVTARSVGAALLSHVGEPVKIGDQTLTLMDGKDRTNLKYYYVRKTGPSPDSA